MPEELCQVSPKSHYVSLALHSDPSPLLTRIRPQNYESVAGFEQIYAVYRAKIVVLCFPVTGGETIEATVVTQTGCCCRYHCLLFKRAGVRMLS